MKARTSTVLLLALTMALVACSRTEAPTDTLELADQAAAPALRLEPLSASPAEAAGDLAILPEVDDIVFTGPDSPDQAEVKPPPQIVASFTLRHGETLHHFARWAGLPVETVAEHSDLDLSGQYNAGATVVVPLDNPDQRGAIETARDNHHSRRAEGYLASRGGAIGAEFVTVATGDSASKIAREQAGIPLWLLQTYNPSVDLERLRPGQELMVPIIADIVVDAEDLAEEPPR